MKHIWLSLLCRGYFKHWLALTQHSLGIDYVFSKDFHQSKEFALMPQKIQQGLRHPDERLLTRVANWLTSSPLHWCMCYHHQDYPESLRSLKQPPLCLFGMGDKACLNSELILAVVGSRKASVQGILATELIVQDLTAAGFVIVSGLALGIDGAAHRAAIKSRSVSVAVLGAACELIYPREHQILAQQIIEHQGAVISEYPVGTSPLPHHFPQRNRIVSALSLGVLVVEAARRSGAMITVNQGLVLGKDIFAMPAGVHNPCGQGGLWLIQQGAKCVISAQDIIDEYPYKMKHRPQKQDTDLEQTERSGINEISVSKQKEESAPKGALEVLACLQQGPQSKAQLLQSLLFTESELALILAELCEQGQVILSSNHDGVLYSVLNQV